MTVDPESGRLFILDNTGPRIVRIDPDSQQSPGKGTARSDNQISQIDLGPTGLVRLGGIAFNPADKHLYLLSSSKNSLYELTVTGQLISIRDLSRFRLLDPQGMVFAPTADPTDDPKEMSLYVVDGGTDFEQIEENYASVPGRVDSSLAPLSEFNPDTSAIAPASAGAVQQRRGRIVELVLSEPIQIVLTASTVPATVVQTINSSAFTPPSTDSAGLVYLPARNRLLVSDSETEETPFFAGANLFEITLSGTLVFTSNISYRPPLAVPFSDEPAGLAFNSDNGHLYIADDDQKQVVELNPGVDRLYGTKDDIITKLFKTDSLDIHPGVPKSTDPEGIAFGNGSLFIVDGKGKEVFKIDPGSDKRFRGDPKDTDGQTATNFDVAQWGFRDPEGLEFKHDSGTLLILDGRREKVIETTTSGNILRQIDISDANPVKQAGLAYAPASNGSGTMNLYIAARGADETNDGKIFEMVIAESHAFFLASFTARMTNDRTVLRWETGLEDENKGFNLYRAAAHNGPYTKINEKLIAARGNTLSGASYVFHDSAAEGVVFYKLENVISARHSTFYGPVSTRSSYENGVVF